MARISRVLGIDDAEITESVEPLLLHFTGPLLLAGGFKPQKAKQYVEQHKDRDIVMAFGHYFISTPDLVFKLQKGVEFNPYNRDTFYLHNGVKGAILIIRLVMSGRRSKRIDREDIWIYPFIRMYTSEGKL